MGRQRTGLAAAFVLIALAASGAPNRTLSEPLLVPPGAGMVFSVPDLPSAWKAFAATPIHTEVVAFLNSPTVLELPRYRQFVEQMRRMEAELGFSLDPPTLAAMIAGFDFVVLPPLERDGPFPTVCLFRVADTTRWQRLVDCIERRMETASNPATTGSTKVVRKDYQGAKIVSTQAGGGTAIAQLGPDRWAFASSAGAITYLIDQSLKKQPLGASPRFRAAVEGLGESQPHGFLYLNNTAVVQGQGVTRLAFLPLSGLVRSLRDEIVVAADFRIEPAAIRFESFLPFADPARDRLGAIYRHYPPGPLRALDYVSSSPVAFMARNTFDGPTLYDQWRAMALTSLRAAAGQGPPPEERLKTEEDNFREQMGFALREDLAAAIGPEAFASLEQVSWDPLQVLPAFDLVAGVQIRDRERMDKVLSGFETFLERRFGADGPVARPPALQSVAYYGKTLKWFLLPQSPQYSIGYTRTDSFVLAGLGGESIKRAVDRVEGRRKPFKDGRLYAIVRPYLHEQANEILVFNVPKMVAVGRDVVRRLPKSPQPNQPDPAKRIESLLASLGRIAALGASTAGSEFGLQTRGALVFTAPEPKKPAK